MNPYRIDAGRSRFTVQAFAAGLLSALGHSPTFAVREFGGDVRLGSTAQSLELDLTISPGSLDLQDAVKDADRRDMEARMRDEVLETAAFREITFHGRATRAETIGQGRYRLTIGGDLTLHGAVHPYHTDAELIVFADGLRLGGSGVLRMSDFGIRPVTALGGAIKLKDELRLTFDLAALPVPS